MKEKNKIAVLIPVYNEEKTIKKIIKEVKKYCEHIIVVVDGSTDKTLDIVRKENVILLVNNVNRGLVYSLKKGYNYALKNGFNAVVKIDGDGQMDLKKIPLLIKEFKERKFDVVSATFEKNTPWMIKKDIFIYTWLFNLATKNKQRDIISEYRIFSRKAMKQFVKSNITNYASNISLIDQNRNGCLLSYINGGVDYGNATERPFPLRGLLDLRYWFIRRLWSVGGFRAKIMAMVSILLLTVLLIFNLTIGVKYNSFFSKWSIR